MHQVASGQTLDALQIPDRLAGTGVYGIATLDATATATYTTTNSPFSATVRLKEFTPGKK